MDTRFLDPINLLDNQTSEQTERYESKFNEFIKTVVGISYTNEKHNLKAGDTIKFLNGYDIPMTTKVLAFKGNEAYLLWDCYWFPIDLDKDFIRKLK